MIFQTPYGDFRYDPYAFLTLLTLTLQMISDKCKTVSAYKSMFYAISYTSYRFFYPIPAYFKVKKNVFIPIFYILRK